MEIESKENAAPPSDQKVVGRVTNLYGPTLIPSFETKEECEEFVNKFREECKTKPTNPDYPECNHLVTTLCDWSQVERFLLDKLAEERKSTVRHRPELPSSNRFLPEEAIIKEIDDRLNLDFHHISTADSTLNTLRYMFFHMRSGIFVSFRKGELSMFVPFVHKDYVNSWDRFFEIEGGSIEAYAQIKRTREKYIPSVAKWWANGNIICNVASPTYWGDSYLPQLKDLLVACGRERKIPDCEFFINKRDYPHLRKNLTEPYEFCFPEQDFPLLREKYSLYTPIASFFLSSEFADLALVCTDDWETATGRVYPPHCLDIRSAKKRSSHDTPWEKRVPTAVFRGGATGGGTTPETNQRLRVAALCAAWEKDPQYNEENPVDGVKYLDAGVVNFNRRDKKLYKRPMTFIRTEEMKEKGVVKPRIDMYMQSSFKYILYIEGHCAAMRYASMMPLGAVILKVESECTADLIWYFPLLKPFDINNPEEDTTADHIPVRKDLSDLGDVLTWCKRNDNICKRIAENSKELFSRLMGREAQLDYMELLLHKISERFKQPIELLESTDTKENENGTMPAFRADCALSVEDRDGLEFSEWFSRGWKTRSEGGLGIQNEGPGSLGWCPDASQDWYGETNRWYTSVGLPMVSDALPPPYFPDLAKNTPGLEYKVYTKYHIVRHQPEQIRDYQPSGTFSSASSTATNSERSREEVQQAAKVNSNFTGLARKRPSLKPSVKNKSFLAALKRQKV